MSRKYGAPFQISYVVEDIDRAAMNWIRNAGIGPFYKIEHIQHEYYSCRGQAMHPDISMAVAYSGSMQIELVSQGSDEKTLVKEFLSTHPQGGMHHVAFLAERDKFEQIEQSAGEQLILSGKVMHGPRFMYLEQVDTPGSVVEIAERSASTLRIFDFLQGQAEKWDGLDPIRLFDLSRFHG